MTIRAIHTSLTTKAKDLLVALIEKTNDVELKNELKKILQELENIGDVIASIRRKKRIDQKSMAEKLDISVSYLSQVENGSKMPSGKLLTKISEELDVPVFVLLFEVLDESDLVDEETRQLFRQSKPLMDKMLALLLQD